MVELHRSAAEAKGVKLGSETTPGATADAHSHAIRLALGNLVKNAIAHSESGTVHISADSTGITVTDSGRGMGAEELAQAQLEFQRGATGEGLGLGLPIVAAVCDRHGWDFSMKSSQGDGTEARIAFRLDADGSREHWSQSGRG